MTRLAVAVTLACALGAWADIAPPNLSGCNGKKAGEACTRDDGSAGACAAAKCTRNDYSEGPPPKQVEYDCLQCAPAAPKVEEKKSSCAAVPGEALGGALALLTLLRRRRGASLLLRLLR